MTEMHSRLDRLEARIDHQAARIDGLYRILEVRDSVRPPAKKVAGYALFDEFVTFDHQLNAEPKLRRATRLRVGDATGV